MNLVRALVLWFSQVVSPGMQPCADLPPPTDPTEEPSRDGHHDWTQARSPCGTNSASDPIYNGF